MDFGQNEADHFLHVFVEFHSGALKSVQNKFIENSQLNLDIVNLLDLIELGFEAVQGEFLYVRISHASFVEGNLIHQGLA